MGRMTVGGRAARAGLATALVTVALAGCSWVKDPDAESGPAEGASSTAAPAPSERPTAVPTAFDNPGATTLPEEDVRKVLAGDDTVISLTPGSVIGRALPGLETTYTLTSTGGQFTDGTADRDLDQGIVLEAANEAGNGTFIGEDTFTLTRFDLTSGEVLDVATAVLPQDPEGEALPATARIAGVAGDVVVIESVVGETGSRATLAVDLELDDVLWRERPARTIAVTGDVAIVNTGRAQEPGAIDAVDLQSGDRVWRALRGTVDASAIGSTTDTVTVVRDLGVGSNPQIVPIDLATGDEGAPTPTDRWNWACTETSDRIAVCTMADDDDVVGWDLEAGRAAWSLPTSERFAPLVTLVQDDLVYGLLDSGVGVVLDARTGADVADDTGAGPVAVNAWGGALLYQQVAVFLPSFAAGSSTDATTGPDLSEPTDSGQPTQTGSPSVSPSESAPGSDVPSAPVETDPLVTGSPSATE